MGIYLTHPVILFFLWEYDLFNFLFTSAWYLPLQFFLTLGISIIIVKLITILPYGDYVVTVASSSTTSSKVIIDTNKIHA